MEALLCWVLFYETLSKGQKNPCIELYIVYNWIVDFLCERFVYYVQSFVLNKNWHSSITIISGAYRRKYKGAGSDKEAEANIGHTLKHAPHRPGGVKIRPQQVRPTSPPFVVV